MKDTSSVCSFSMSSHMLALPWNKPIRASMASVFITIKVSNTSSGFMASHIQSQDWISVMQSCISLYILYSTKNLQQEPILNDVMKVSQTGPKSEFAHFPNQVDCQYFLAGVDAAMPCNLLLIHTIELSQMPTTDQLCWLSCVYCFAPCTCLLLSIPTNQNFSTDMKDKNCKSRVQIHKQEPYHRHNPAICYIQTVTISSSNVKRYSVIADAAHGNGYFSSTSRFVRMNIESNDFTETKPMETMTCIKSDQCISLGCS